MSTATRFRALVIAQGSMPYLTVVSALLIPTPPGEPPGVQMLPDDWWVALGALALAASQVATIGLFLFKSWAPRIFALAIVCYAVGVGTSDGVILTGVEELMSLIDGVLIGAIASWLLVARDRLPFPQRSRFDPTSGEAA